MSTLRNPTAKEAAMQEHSPPRTLRRSARLLGLVLGLPTAALHAQWNVSLRAMQNPLPVGQCTAVEVVVLGAGGAAPVRPDGQQVSGWDFDLELAGASVGAFAWQDERHRVVCALAPASAPARITATYPARHLGAAEIVPNLLIQQTLDVFAAGVAQPVAQDGAQGYGTGHPPGPTPQPYPAQGGYPTHGGDPAHGGYPPQGAYPQQPPAARLPDTTRVRSGKQFLRRITGFAKGKASEVAANTTTQVADATGDVIGSTLETGSQVVKSGAGAVTGAAGEQVRGLGKALGAKQDPKDPEDVAAALAAGRAVLRGLRFTEGTAILEPSSGPLISQVAGALARTPGQFLIEAHVDGTHSPAAQALSEQRAAAVKAALVAAGSSPMQLAAVGYGASRPVPGAARSARIEIARTQ